MAYKYRIYPSANQIKVLNEQLKLCRELYNACLQQRKLAHEKGVAITYRDQQDQLPEIRRAFPEYMNIHSQVLQDVVRRLHKAYDNAFRRVKERKAGKNVRIGFPRFKGEERYRSITYSQSGFHIMENNHLHVSKIGEIRMFMHREISGRIKTMTISMDAVGDWFVSFSVDDTNNASILERKSIPLTEKTALGYDKGLISLIAGSDDYTVEAPKFFRKGENGIKRSQRNVSRKRKGSKNREKAKLRLAKKHRKVKRQREDFTWKTANTIVSRSDIIFLEDLNVQGMVQNHHLAKSITDASWSMLTQYTTYKAESAGKMVELVDPGGTSQTCSRCGWIKKDLDLSDRMYQCNICGLDIDRDLNAAINIRNGGLEKLRKLAEGIREVTPVETGALLERATPIVEAGSPLRQRGEDVTHQWQYEE